MMRCSAVLRRGLIRGDNIIQSEIVQNNLNTKQMKFDTQLKVNNFFEDKLIDSCNIGNIADLLSTSSSVSSRSKSASFLKPPHLAAVGIRLNSFVPQLNDFEDVATVCFSLRHMKATDRGVVDILSFVTMAATRFACEVKVTRSRHISWLLLGLSGSSYNVDVNAKFLCAVAAMIQGCETDFEHQSASNTLYAMRGMCSDYVEVCSIMSAMASRILDCTGDFDAREVGNAIYGLRRMTSDHPEVRRVLSSLARKIGSGEALLDGQAVGNSLYGLQGMNSQHAEVRELLASLRQFRRVWSTQRFDKFGVISVH